MLLLCLTADLLVVRVTGPPNSTSPKPPNPLHPTSRRFIDACLACLTCVPAYIRCAPHVICRRTRVFCNGVVMEAHRSTATRAALPSTATRAALSAFSTTSLCLNELVRRHYHVGCLATSLRTRWCVVLYKLVCSFSQDICTRSATRMSQRVPTGHPKSSELYGQRPSTSLQQQQHRNNAALRVTKLTHRKETLPARPLDTALLVSACGSVEQPMASSLVC